MSSIVICDTCKEEITKDRRYYIIYERIKGSMQKKGTSTLCVVCYSKCAKCKEDS